MTTQRIYSIENFIGLSTDDKPSTAMIGSEYLEYDTKNIYVVYDKVADVSQWVLKK